VGYSGGRVEVVEFPSLQPFDAWDDEGGDVTALVYSLDGRRLAVGTRQGARVRDPEGHSFASPNWPHPSSVVVLAFDGDRGRLCTVALDAKARMFAISGDSTAPLYDPVPHSLGQFGVSHGGPDAVAPRFLDDGRFLVTITGKNDLAWRDAATGALLATIPTINESPVTALNASSDGQSVAVNWTGTGRIFSAKGS
jgi:WD40 repeat protein